MKKVNHIAIAVKDIEKSNDLFSKIFGKSSYKKEVIIKEGIETAFFKIGDAKIELISPTKKDTPVDKFLNKRKEGLHHICFEVDEISEEISRLISEGIRILEPHVRQGAEGRLISFLNPKDTNGVLIELSQRQDCK